MKIINRMLTLALMLGLTLAAFTLTASAAEETAYGIGFVDASSLRLRKEASESASILAEAPRGECVVVLSQENDWYRVSYNLQEGYMHGDYLQVSTKENAELGYGNVNGTEVNLRSGPGTSYSSLGRVSTGDQCYILGLNEGWYKVIAKDSIGYIRSDYVTLTEYPYENQASSNSPRFFRHGKAIGAAPSAGALSGNAPSSSRQKTPAQQEATVPKADGSGILAEAEKHLGVRYVYGGASPSGFDCSGFVYYVLKQCGYSPYRTPADQYKQGTAVDKDELQVGDIVFFANTYASGLSHVGIYAGDGQFIHSPNSRSTVSYSDLTSGYWSDHYYGARRMG